MKKNFTLVAVLIVVAAVIGAYTKVNFPQYLTFPKREKTPINRSRSKEVIISEESVIVKVVAQSMPSVVTVGIKKTIATGGYTQIDPFNFFSPFKRIPGRKRKIEKNIGSGFIISEDGLIITNKHVVSDTDASYQVLTDDKQKYSVVNIYRDPLNDLAIIKIKPKTKLKALKLGDSSKLKLGQLAIAIGTPLGEFTNTVTSGIVSGLGRGITAGSPYEGFVEKLDNVIQTDAAINPGNSGGPLLNSSSEVIGINTAVSTQGQNIGFAIPASVIKNLITSFRKRGSSFDRPFIGVRYKIIDRQTAVLNNLPQGAYIISIVANSPAEKAGLQVEDIIITLDGKRIDSANNQELAKLILQKKVGDKIKMKIWRNGKIIQKTLTLENYH